MRGLSEKRFIVAGGATGIGAATAERLAEEGARVVIGDLNEAGAQATVQRIAAAGGRAWAIPFDMGSESSVAGFIDAAIAHLGGVDGLANIAADLSPENLGRDGDLLDMDVTVWERTLRVNLIGYALTCRGVLPHMVEQGSGAIVNCSSGAAHIGLANRVAYSSSKAGINALTRHVARRWGPDHIRCNAVMPGMVMNESGSRNWTPEFVATAIAGIPLGRVGRPADLAQTICFLLSDDADWVTGQVWSVNGGSAFRD